MEIRSAPEVLHVRLERDADGYPPFDFEEVQGQRVGDHIYELLSAPAWAHGLAIGDVVTIGHFPETPDVLWVVQMHRVGEHSTIRVIGLGGREPTEPAQIASDHGCLVAPTSFDRMIAIDVPPAANFPILYQALLVGRESQKWDTNVGVLSDVHAKQMRIVGMEL